MKGFMVCLEKNRRELKDKIANYSDFQLISNICVKERLTLFNFLVECEISNKDAKEFINRQYMNILRNKIYTPVLKIDKKVEDYFNIYSKPVEH
jgi:hypothetical protein